MRVAALLVGLTMAVAACGGDDPTLNGLERDEPLEVGAVTLPEVFPSGGTQPFAMKAQPGELLVVYFGYTSCPDLCPTTLTDVRTALEQMGDDGGRVDVAFATVDPERDTPSVITKYLGSFVEGDAAHPLRTEDTAELRQAEEAFLASSTVTKQPDGTVEVAHTASTYVVDEDGRVLVEWPFGISWRAMQDDLDALLDRVS